MDCLYAEPTDENEADYDVYEPKVYQSDEVIIIDDDDPNSDNGNTPNVYQSDEVIIIDDDPNNNNGNNNGDNRRLTNEENKKPRQLDDSDLNNNSNNNGDNRRLTNEQNFDKNPRLDKADNASDLCYSCNVLNEHSYSCSFTCKLCCSHSHSQISPNNHVKNKTKKKTKDNVKSSRFRAFRCNTCFFICFQYVKMQKHLNKSKRCQK